MKEFHEIRDPVHTFVRLDSDERRVLDSRAVQRLRHVHQLAMTHLVYPGATHKRFEHSLGVMEVATRIFDVVTRGENLHPEVRYLVPTSELTLLYWRRLVRMAALCHDIGHLPFSHAAENELLPDGWDHERITAELIRSEEMRRLLPSLEPGLDPERIVKLALGPKKAKAEFSDWEAILAEIVVGDAFGADRIDYLLRDSLHAGVAYGRFDHHRLIDTLRILPKTYEESVEPALGVQVGGLQSAEALLLARYFMYSQVYHHPVRRIYDHHLKEFLSSWLDEGHFSVKAQDHLALTDHDVYSELLRGADDPDHAGHAPASRIVGRKHFREVYRRNAADVEVRSDAPVRIAAALRKEFGSRKVVYDTNAKRKGKDPTRDEGRDRDPGSFDEDFPVSLPDDRVVSAYAQSEVLKTIPPVTVDSVFVEPGIRKQAARWLDENRDKIIRAENDDEEASDGAA